MIKYQQRMINIQLEYIVVITALQKMIHLR